MTLQSLMYLNSFCNLLCAWQEQLQRLASRLAECSSPRGDLQLQVGGGVRAGPKQGHSRLAAKVHRVRKESSSGSDSRHRPGIACKLDVSLRMLRLSPRRRKDTGCEAQLDLDLPVHSNMFKVQNIGAGWPIAGSHSTLVAAPEQWSAIIIG